MFCNKQSSHRNNLGKPICEILFIHLLSQSVNKLRVISVILFVPFGALAQQLVLEPLGSSVSKFVFETCLMKMGD